jgi:hypothetical protein
MTFSYTFTKTGELPYFFDFGGEDEDFVSSDDDVVYKDGNDDEVLLLSIHPAY